MFSRYGAATDNILKMPYKKGYEMYVKCIEKEQEDKLFLRWLNGYQFKMSFDEFKAELIGNKTPEAGKEQSELDIYLKVSDILRKGK